MNKAELEDLIALTEAGQSAAMNCGDMQEYVALFSKLNALRAHYSN